MKESVTPRRTAAKSLRLLKLVVRTLDDKKAEDLRVLEVSRQSSITDYLVLATGTSEPHLRALRAELEEVFDEAKIPVIGIESTQGSGWTVLDAFEVMVHLFTAENRAKYRLEMLWKDAVVMTVTRLLGRSQAAGERTESAPTAKLMEKTA
jgi:ribosome-associated protein